MQPILTDSVFKIHNMVLLVNVTLRSTPEEAFFSFKDQEDRDIRKKTAKHYYLRQTECRSRKEERACPRGKQFCLQN